MNVQRTPLNSLCIYLGVLALTGLSISLYTYYVNIKLESGEDYTAACDISEHVSCSKVFKSQYSKGLGIFAEDSFFYTSNSLYGIPFYIMMMILAFSTSRLFNKFLFASLVLSNLLSVYFAYLLYFVIQNLCVACVAIYIVNALSLLTLYKKLKLLNMLKIKNN
ncbi:hypothetical protein HHI36_015570 [Cryptolaemus montrouzieri]|uniref:vitamin-K-epoxide reductase (warfarin-sensitive) n=1 Tax=Cryptolaemus montrouzieri TaxID=559131 RepID=A0ABD2N5Y2_9CUCU